MTSWAGAVTSRTGAVTFGTRVKHASAVTYVTNVTAGPAVIMSLLSS